MATTQVVREFMSRPVRTLARNDALSMADTRMRADRIRHLPIVDDGRVVGVVSQRDLFLNALVRALGFGSTARDRALHTLVVKEVMTSPAITTTSDTPIAEAARIMVERKIGCLPVVDEGQLVGILSESDIVSAVARGAL